MLTANDLDQFNQRIPEVMPTLYARLIRPIYAFVRSQFDKELSKDIVKDSFLKLWDSPKEFTTETDLKNYLFIITRNNCADIHRRNTEHLALVRATGIENQLEEAQKHLSREVADIIDDLEILQLLAPREAVVAALSFIEGKKDKEIAKEIKVSVSTVKRIKRFAKQKLKALINNRLLLIAVITATAAPGTWLLSKKTFTILTLFNNFLVFTMDQY